MILMKRYTSQDITNEEILECVIPDNGIIDVECPLKLIVKFCHEYLNSRKRRNHRRVTSSASMDKRIENESPHTPRTESSFVLSKQKMWHQTILSLTDGERKSLRLFTDYLKLESLVDVLDLPLYLKQIERDSSLTSKLAKKTKKQLASIAESYFSYHKERGRDDKWDKLFCNHYEDYFLKILNLSFENECQSLCNTLFNYCRIKVSDRMLTISSKIEKIEFPNSFLDLSNTFCYWFSLTPGKKKNSIFKKSKPKPINIFFTIVLLSLTQKFIEALPALIIPRQSAVNYGNYYSIKLDFKPVEITQGWTLLKRLKDEISETLIKEQLFQTVQKKRQGDFINLMNTFTSSARFNEIYNDSCKLPNAMDFVFRYCISNCFSKKPYWVIDESKTLQEMNRRTVINKDQLSQLNLPLEGFSEDFDNEQPSNQKLTFDDLMSLPSASILLSTSPMESIGTLDTDDENQESNKKSKHSRLVSLVFLTPKDQIHILPNSDVFKEAFNFSKSQITDKKATPLQARKAAREKYPQLTSQELSSLYLELVKIKK